MVHAFPRAHPSGNEWMGATPSVPETLYFLPQQFKCGIGPHPIFLARSVGKQHAPSHSKRSICTCSCSSEGARIRKRCRRGQINRDHGKTPWCRNPQGVLALPNKSRWLMAWIFVRKPWAALVSFFQPQLAFLPCNHARASLLGLPYWAPS